MAFYRTTDLDGDKLHLKTFGAGHGTISRTEEVTTSLTNGQETGTRTQTYTQNGWDNSFAFAHGNLSDTAGHTGTWNSSAVTGDSINDKVTITSGLASGTWTESSRTFAVDQKKAGNSAYHQEDNGLGASATPAWLTETRQHVIDAIMSYRDDETRNGSPNNYSFSWNRGSEYNKTETTRGSYDDGSGASGNSSTKTSIRQVMRDIQVGTSLNGQQTLSRIDQVKVNDSWRVGSGVSETPKLKMEYKNGSFTDNLEYRIGNDSVCSGSRSTDMGYLNWSRSLDKTAWWGGTSTTGSEDWGRMPSVRTNLSGGRLFDQPDATLWGTFWGDVGRTDGVVAVSNAGTWAWDNAGNLIRIVGGAAEVLVGLAMVTGTLGGGAVPGFAIMAMGADQIIIGEVNLMTGKDAPSMIEYAFYSGAKVLGGGEGGAQTAMRWGPTVLSIGLSGGFGGLVNFGRTAALAGLKGGRAVFQFTNVAGTLGIRAAEGLSNGLVAGTRSGLQAGRSVLQAVTAALEERAMIRLMQAEAGVNLGLRSATPQLVHLTSVMAKQSIEGSVPLLLWGRGGIFAIPQSLASNNSWMMVLRTGVGPLQTAAQVVIPKAALHLFRRPIPIGPYSAWKYFGQAYYAPPGVINLATGSFTRWSSLMGPRTVIYGPDILFYMGVSSAAGLYGWASSVK